MTENTDTTLPPSPPQPPPVAPRPPLRRSSSDRVMAGVAGGIAEWLGIDPVIVRVVLVVLALFGGTGLVLYAVGWLFIPDSADSTSEAERFIAKGSRPGSGVRTALIVGAAVVATMVLLNLLSSSHGLWLMSGGGSLLLLIAVGALVLWLVNRDRGSTPAAPLPASSDPAVVATAAPTPAAQAAQGAQPTDTVVAELPAGFAYGGSGQYPGYVAPVPVPAAPRKPRSYLGLAVLSVSVLVMGVLASISLSGVAYVPAVVVLASGLAVLGIGLLIGAVAGHAKWLMWIAVPLLMVTALVAVIPANLHLSGMTTIGERNWQPTTAAEATQAHSLTIGDARLDLTTLALAPGTITPITAEVGIGQIRVIAPPGMRVLIKAKAGIGTIKVEGLPKLDGPRITLVDELPGAVSSDAATVELDVQAGMGDVEVRRA